MSDERDPLEPNTIVARSGFLFEREQKKRHAAAVRRLGVRQREERLARHHFNNLTIRPEDLGIIEHDPGGDLIGELRRTIAKGRAGGHPNYEAEAELARKYTIPFATVLFALLGVSLGLKPARGGQSERFEIALALFFLYYALMRVGRALAERGKLDALLAMSIPDVAFTILALWLFYRSARIVKATSGCSPWTGASSLPRWPALGPPASARSRGRTAPPARPKRSDCPPRAGLGLSETPSSATTVAEKRGIVHLRANSASAS